MVEPKGTETEVKGATPTPEVKEGDKPTDTEDTPTADRFYKTEADFQAAVSKGLESITRQHSLAQAEAKKAQAEIDQHKAEIAHRDAYIESLKKEVEEALVDDPERRQAYVSRIAGLEREQKIAKREAEAESAVYQAELRVWQAGMGLKAQALIAEFPGLNLNAKELIGTSATEEEMENKVLRMVAKQDQEKEETKKKEDAPKFDSGLSSGGIDIKNLSPEEKFKRARALEKK